MNLPQQFRCLMVRKTSEEMRFGVEQIGQDQLPAGDVLIRVAYSSLNYKDALACEGTKGIVERLPHVPGIDCAGEVVSNGLIDYSPGDQVLVTGYGLGSAHWGGYSEYVRVPAEWIVSLPAGLTTRQAMTYGTAGFTAAQAVDALQQAGIAPHDGEIVVTGASGGVGSLSVALLAKLGYRVAAVTGKPEWAERLQVLGAERVLARADVNDDSRQPLLKAQWAGAIDTVGGEPLATLIRSTQHRGCVAACGLVAGSHLPLTVYPFILRGVKLHGIDSAQCPREVRLRIWKKLAGEWRLPQLGELAREVTLEDLTAEVPAMLQGKSAGRVVVRLGSLA